MIKMVNCWLTKNTILALKTYLAICMKIPNFSKSFGVQESFLVRSTFDKTVKHLNDFKGIVMNPWENSNGIRKRKLEYKSNIEGIGAAKLCTTFEEEVIFHFKKKLAEITHSF